MKNFYPPPEISPLGEFLAESHFRTTGVKKFPIDPEIIAAKYFGMDILPKPQLMSVGVKSGIDTTQSVIFIDEKIYMNDTLRYLSNQSIGHELAHAIFDVSLIRQSAGTTVEDAFARHAKLIEENPGIESRAHILSGSFLVPRTHLIRQVALRLAENYEKVMSINPDMTIQQVFESMAASKLGGYFCQSDSVIKWRLEQEKIHEALLVSLDTPVKNINLRHLAKLADMEYKRIALSDRIKFLLPEDLLRQYETNLGWA